MRHDTDHVRTPDALAQGSLGDAAGALATATPTTRRLAAHSLSANTRAAYSCALRQFDTWRGAAPATDATLDRADSVLWASRDSGAQRAPAPTNTSHEHTANVLLKVYFSNSVEGAVGRSVSPAPAWRRGPSTAKHRPRVAAVRRHAVASAPAPSTHPVRVGPSTRATTAARPRPVARSVTPATTLVSAPPRPVRGCRRTLQTQRRASSTGVAREGIVLIASSGPRGTPVRREPPHQQTPPHEHRANVFLE